jgi:hypothetical protein
LCTKITAGDPLGWSEKSPALGLKPLTLGIQGQRLHHSSTEPLLIFKGNTLEDNSSFPLLAKNLKKQSFEAQSLNHSGIFFICR